jgi:ABC-type spermidine/putrescine transport system permease subunit II
VRRFYTQLVGAPFVPTLPVYMYTMYTASVGSELQIASVTVLVLLLLLERFLKAGYLAFLGQV